MLEEKEPNKKPRTNGRNLIDQQASGGGKALRGFDFQRRYALLKLIELMPDANFSSIIVEGVEDVEVRFSRNEKAERSAIQVKNHRVTKNKAREIINSFAMLDQDSPGTWSSFTIVSTELDEDLKSVHNGLLEYRRFVSGRFYNSDEAILANTRSEVERRIRALKLPEAFVLDRVYFEPELNMYAKEEWVQAKALDMLQSISPGISRSAAIGIYLQLHKLVFESTRVPIPRQEALSHIPSTSTSPKKIKLLTFEPATIRIDAGRFVMGSDQHNPEEANQEEVLLPSYKIGVFPVTTAQYAEFIRATKRVATSSMEWNGNDPPEERLEYPVTGVTWYEAIAYCEWLSCVTGKNYMLPNEAQWEKAARFTDGRLFPWGMEWVPDRCNISIGITQVTHFPAQSNYGCFDMVGNTGEWTLTAWGLNLNQPDKRFAYPWKDDLRNDPRHSSEILRVFRGGRYTAPEDYRCSARSAWLPNRPGPSDFPIGFRVVLLEDD